jgi:hypothetical protein
MTDREKARAAREKWYREMQGEVEELLSMLDNLAKEGERPTQTLKRLLQHVPHDRLWPEGQKPEEGGPIRGAPPHAWKPYKGDMVRCSRCGIYDEPMHNGVLAADVTRECVEADLDKTKTLVLTVEYDDSMGQQTMELRPPWEALSDLRAMLGIDAEKEMVEALEGDIIRRRMLRVALVQLMMRATARK